MMVPEGRIVEKIIEAHKSNDLTPLIAWLEKLGCTDITRDQDSATLTGLTGMRAGFILGDPVTLAVCTGFALFGPHWASICPTLFRESQQALEDGDKEGEGRQSCERLAPINAPIAIVACR